MTQTLPKAIRRIPTPLASLCFLALLGGALAVFMGRTVPSLRSEAVLALAPDFYAHVSNFSLSYLVYAAIGYAWLMLGVRRGHLLLLGLVMLLCGLAYELFLPVLNTRDPVDAVYGAAGTALAAVVLLLIDRYGMRSLPSG